jgi:hypothetical protein
MPTLILSLEVILFSHGMVCRAILSLANDANGNATDAALSCLMNFLLELMEYFFWPQTCLPAGRLTQIFTD